MKDLTPFFCLGAQLIGEALGSKYDHSPEKEIGYFPITLTSEGKNDPLLAKFNSSEVVGHWHGDMPGLTDTAKVLAVSDGCPRQIVRYSKLVYGFQCHLELIKDDFEELILHSSDDFSNRDNERFVQSETTIRNTPTQHINHLLSDFMDNIMAVYISEQNMPEGNQNSN